MKTCILRATSDCRAAKPRPLFSGPVSTPDGKDADEFDWQVLAKEEEKMKRKKVARLHCLAEALNYQLTPE